MLLAIRCASRVSSFLRIVGASNSVHILGTHVPVEEPSTASIADIEHRAQPCFLALSGAEPFFRQYPRNALSTKLANSFWMRELAIRIFA
jgi:hypothetical protein